MRYTTIHLGTNKIELFNSMLGKETVKVDGEIVSSKYSMLGADHTFNITEDGREVECTIQIGFGASGVVFDLYKDGEPIIESEKSRFFDFAMIIAFFTGIAIAVIFS